MPKPIPLFPADGLAGALMLAAALMLPAAAGAQTPAYGGRPASVKATGDAVIYAKPDQARIDLGVVTQAATAQAAASQNAAQSQAVLDKLRAALGSKADIKTVGYSLNPNYKYPRDGSQPTIEGYTAANTVQLTSDDLEGLGKLIDAATQGGANHVQRLQFTLKNEAVARGKALRQAAAEARGNAEAMAQALGLKLGRVIQVDQGAPEAIRPVVRQMAAVAAAPTPIESGQIEVRASVTLTIAVD